MGHQQRSRDFCNSHEWKDPPAARNARGWREAQTAAYKAGPASPSSDGVGRGQASGCPKKLPQKEPMSNVVAEAQGGVGRRTTWLFNPMSDAASEGPDARSEGGRAQFLATEDR